jgi:hypothetical protein
MERDRALRNLLKSFPRKDKLSKDIDVGKIILQNPIEEKYDDSLRGLPTQAKERVSMYGASRKRGGERISLDSISPQLSFTSIHESR